MSTPTAVYDVKTGGNGYCAALAASTCKSQAGFYPNQQYGTVDCAWKPDSSTLSSGTRACDALAGYDGASGVGTPTGTTLFKALAPTAVITPPSTITHGTAATFASTRSTDPFPGGSISTSTWAWGDGTASSTSASVQHTFAKAGTFTVTLTVKDNYGRTSPAVSTSVTVK